jgi:hypothetical protein
MSQISITGAAGSTTATLATGPSISISPGTLTVDLWNTSATSAGYYGTGYSIANVSGSIFDSNPLKVSNTGQLALNGDNADIKINGQSLSTWMKTVDQRLAILRPDPELEAEWEELKQLSNRYRELEQEITEKMKTWEIISKE